ncbi:MAG: 23S rRNA (adenine(2503)-C(2))-methyltransferase RlmN [Pirellulaceae bacterium]
MKSILSSLNELPDWLKDNNQPAFRAKQIKRWLFDSRIDSFDQMSDLPAALRTKLQEHFHFWDSEILVHQKSEDGTEKLLLKMAAGGEIECVLLRDEHRRTICVSSQVGCAMGCVFCASGLNGVERSLTEGEIIEQMLRLSRCLPPDERLSHIVMMGMGDPLANLGGVVPALAEASSPTGLGISARRITISTVGIPKAIRRLADMDFRYHLAISLHAPNDELRTRLVPVNRNTGIEAILDSSDYFFEKTGRRITFEYVLLAGINDSPEQAMELASVIGNRCALLNVIPYNPVEGLPYRTPSPDSIFRFKDILEAEGITIKFRQRKGSDINAACGQLRRNNANPNVVPLGTTTSF